MEGKITFMGTWWRLEPDERFDPQYQWHQWLTVEEVLKSWSVHGTVPEHIYLCLNGKPLWEVPFERLEKNV